MASMQLIRSHGLSTRTTRALAHASPLARSASLTGEIQIYNFQTSSEANVIVLRLPANASLGQVEARLY